MHRLIREANALRGIVRDARADGEPPALLARLKANLLTLTGGNVRRRVSAVLSLARAHNCGTLPWYEYYRLAARALSPLGVNQLRLAHGDVHRRLRLFHRHANSLPVLSARQIAARISRMSRRTLIQGIIYLMATSL